MEHPLTPTPSTPRASSEPRPGLQQDSYGMVEYNFGSLPTRESAEALRSWDLTQPCAEQI